MLFDFALTPLERTAPWGEPGHEMLHWFGLTDGTYWLDVGDQTLFEYSEAVRAAHGWPRHCEYHVARLYEDLIDMLPCVLEAIPTSLLPYISGESESVWRGTWLKWQGRLDGLQRDHSAWEIADAANTWIQQRSLDTLYLSPGARIRMWSDQSRVFVGWDNIDKLYGGLPAWSATVGVAQFPRESFLEEVWSFHERVMREMEERIEQVLAGALPPHIQIDHLNLKTEHEQRRHSLGSALASLPIATEWGRVQKAILEIEREVGRNAAI